MSQIEKLEAKIRRNPNDVTFHQMKRVLEYYDFVVENNSGGSHYSVSHELLDLSQVFGHFFVGFFETIPRGFFHCFTQPSNPVRLTIE